MSAVVDEIARLWRERAHLDYGESVTTVEHMLQCALFAEQDGAHDTLVAATVLHDIGHLLHGLPQDIADRGVDGEHEEVGGRWLERHFVDAVSAPVRLHVPAKRYLCAVEPSYRAGLSPASERSLILQGGPFGEDEVAAFEALPHWEDAVRLRRYDDRGKVPGMTTPDLEHFRPQIVAGLRPS